MLSALRAKEDSRVLYRGKGKNMTGAVMGVFKSSPSQTRVGESGVSHDGGQDPYIQRDFPLDLEDTPSSSHGLSLMLSVLGLL